MSGVSVVVTTYNRTEFLQEAIESILKQTCPVHEVLIIDDYSESSYAAALVAITNLDTKITLLSNDQNKGVSFSRNRGIEKSTGDFICFLDDDDTYDIQFIEKALAEFESDLSVEAVVGKTNVLECSGGSKARLKVETLIEKREKFYGGIDVNTADYFLIHCPMVHSFLFKKSAFEEFQFAEDLTYGEDMYLWLEMVQNGVKFKKMDWVSSYVRIEEDFNRYPYRLKNRFHEKLLLSGLLNESREVHIQAMRVFYFRLKHREIPSLKEFWEAIKRPFGFMKFSWMNLMVMIYSIGR